MQVAYNIERNRATTNLAVFGVLLIRHRVINHHGYAFAAIWAINWRFYYFRHGGYTKARFSALAHPPPVGCRSLFRPVSFEHVSGPPGLVAQSFHTRLESSRRRSSDRGGSLQDEPHRCRRCTSSRPATRAARDSARSTHRSRDRPRFSRPGCSEQYPVDTPPTSRFPRPTQTSCRCRSLGNTCHMNCRTSCHETIR